MADAEAKSGGLEDATTLAVDLWTMNQNETQTKRCWKAELNVNAILGGAGRATTARAFCILSSYFSLWRMP